METMKIVKARWKCPCVPALRGLGTPPTKTVFLGSSGSVASSTKSASLSFQGRIWTNQSWVLWVSWPITAHLHGLVLDGGGADAEVELVLVLDALLDQLLDRALVLTRLSYHHFTIKIQNFIENKHFYLPGKAERRNLSVESKIYSLPCEASPPPGGRTFWRRPWSRPRQCLAGGPPRTPSWRTSPGPRRSWSGGWRTAAPRCSRRTRAPRPRHPSPRPDLEYRYCTSSHTSLDQVFSVIIEVTFKVQCSF